MSDNPQDNPEPNQPHGSLQEVLRLAVANTAANPDLTPSASHIPNSMDPERREWLNNVLSNLSTNAVTEDIKKSIQSIRENLELYHSNNSNEEVLKSIENKLEELTDHTGSLDNANDFQKMGGFDLMPQLLLINREGIQCRTADLIAELVQNNPYCQDAALHLNLLKYLLELVDSHHLETIRIKALYALSCLIRQNVKAQGNFESVDGFSVLLRAMQSDVKKLRIKISFLLNSLCNQQTRFKELLQQMGFVEQIIGLLHSERDESHEHLLSTLLCLVKDYPPSKLECQRNDLGLESLLQGRITTLSNQDQEAFQDEIDYCKRLLDICFSDVLTPDLER